MWMGDYEPINLLGLLIQSVFIENFLLAQFLGMCTYLACSDRVKTANGLGAAVRAGLAVMIQAKKAMGPMAASARPSHETIGSTPRANCTSAWIEAAAR